MVKIVVKILVKIHFQTQSCLTLRRCLFNDGRIEKLFQKIQMALNKVSGKILSASLLTLNIVNSIYFSIFLIKPIVSDLSIITVILFLYFVRFPMCLLRLW